MRKLRDATNMRYIAIQFTMRLGLRNQWKIAHFFQQQNKAHTHTQTKQQDRKKMTKIQCCMTCIMVSRIYF